MATQVRVPVPSSVASWSTRPAPFSTRKHGRNAKFSVDNTVAERVGEWDSDALVYILPTQCHLDKCGRLQYWAPLEGGVLDW